MTERSEMLPGTTQHDLDVFVVNEYLKKRLMQDERKIRCGLVNEMDPSPVAIAEAWARIVKDGKNQGVERD